MALGSILLFFSAWFLYELQRTRVQRILTWIIRSAKILVDHLGHALDVFLDPVWRLTPTSIKSILVTIVKSFVYVADSVIRARVRAYGKSMSFYESYVCDADSRSTPVIENRLIFEVFIRTNDYHRFEFNPLAGLLYLPPVIVYFSLERSVRYLFGIIQNPIATSRAWTVTIMTVSILIRAAHCHSARLCFILTLPRPLSKYSGEVVVEEQQRSIREKGTM